MQRTDSLEKTLMLGKIEGRKRRGQERMTWLDGIIDSMDVSTAGDSEGQGSPDLTERLNNNTGPEAWLSLSPPLGVGL